MQLKEDQNNLSRLLTFLLKVMQEESLESALQKCLLFLGEREWNPIEARSQLLQDLKRDQKEEFLYSPVENFLTPDANVALDSFNKYEFLLHTALKYLNQTEYLLPLLHCFAQSIMSLSSEFNNGPIHLLLRDGVAFWPSLLAINEKTKINEIEIPVYLVSYARPHRNFNWPPLIYQQTQDQYFFSSLAKQSNNGTLIDVGIYGSLIQDLINKGYFSKDCAVIFLGSRNPFITGWINKLLGAEIMMKSASCAYLPDIIRIVDTLESLLKPFHFGPHGEVRLSNPIAFVCSALFLRAAYRFSQHIILNQQKIDPIECLKLVNTHLRSQKEWAVGNVVPRWSEAERFVQSWALGPLFPMNQLSGFSL